LDDDTNSDDSDRKGGFAVIGRVEAGKDTIPKSM